MQISEIISRVRSTVSDQDKVTISDRELVEWINDAVFELSRALEYKQRNGKADVLSGINEYEMSGDMIKIYGVKYKQYTLDPINYNEFINKDHVCTGTPFQYCVWGASIHLYPTPDENVTNGLQVFYLGIPNKVKSPADFPDLPSEYHSRIVEYCCNQAYMKDTQFDAASIMQAKYDVNTANQARVKDGAEYPHIRSEYME